MPRKFPPYKGERIIGYDPAGAYVTASGKNIPAHVYEAAIGKGKAEWQKESFTGKLSKPKPVPVTSQSISASLPANIHAVAAAAKKNPKLFSAGKGGYTPPAAPATKPTPPKGGGQGTPGFQDMVRRYLAANGGAFDAPNVDLSFLDELNPNVNRLIPVKLAQGGARMLGKSAAERMAGLQFDPQIQDLQIEQLRTDRQNAQNVSDIGNWYQQVLGGLRTAATRDAAINRAAGKSVTDSTASIVSALGGAANQGSALVGAAGAEAAGTLAALGVAQEQYNADLAPLLQAEAAGAKSREAALGSARAHDLATRLAQARGQRGQAQAAAEFDIQQANNQIRDNRLSRDIAIRQSNNQSRQANFGNTFGIGTTKLSTQISGINAAIDAADSKTRQLDAVTRLAKAALDAKKASTPKLSFVPWAKAPKTTKDAAYNDVVGVIQEAARSGQMTRAEAAMAAARYLVGAYKWKASNTRGMIYAALNNLESEGTVEFAE